MKLSVAEHYQLQKQVFCLKTAAHCHVSGRSVGAHHLLLIIHQEREILPAIPAPLEVNLASDVGYFFSLILDFLDVLSQTREFLEWLWRVYRHCSLLMLLLFHYTASQLLCFNTRMITVMTMGHSYFHIIRSQACCNCTLAWSAFSLRTLPSNVCLFRISPSVHVAFVANLVPLLYLFSILPCRVRAMAGTNQRFSVRVTITRCETLFELKQDTKLSHDETVVL